MIYISTRGQAPALGFAEAMMTGLARDGGLYLPQSLPHFAPETLAALAGRPYEEIALAVLTPFVGTAFGEGAKGRDRLADLIARAYQNFAHPARAPLRQLAPNRFLLELFHGPTAAFKDFAMQLLAQMMEAELTRTGGRVTIIGATSGDTGAAAIEAFAGLSHVDVFILFPEGRVSEVQRRQMTTPAAANVHALALAGDFDDAQALVKALFNDLPFRDEVGLAGVNSINWARVLAQSVYYFSAALSLGAPHRPVSFAVPTGNFGDIYAGSLARSMGLPIDQLILATNQNDILHRALESGEYRRGKVHPSISPSMDIQIASNFERALHGALGGEAPALRALMAELAETGGFHLPQGAWQALRAAFASGRASEGETRTALAAEAQASGVLLCPHTAVAAHVAAQHPGRAPMIVLGTAHPGKFPQAVVEATGQTPPLPPHLAAQAALPERVTEVPNEAGALQALIRARRQGGRA